MLWRYVTETEHCILGTDAQSRLSLRDLPMQKQAHKQCLLYRILILFCSLVNVNTYKYKCSHSTSFHQNPNKELKRCFYYFFY